VIMAPVPVDTNAVEALILDGRLPSNREIDPEEIGRAINVLVTSWSDGELRRRVEKVTRDATPSPSLPSSSNEQQQRPWFEAPVWSLESWAARSHQPKSLCLKLRANRT
jgi:hypothetical protein